MTHAPWAELRMSWLISDIRDLEALLREHGPEAAKYMKELPYWHERLGKVVKKYTQTKEVA